MPISRLGLSISRRGTPFGNAHAVKMTRWVQQTVNRSNQPCAREKKRLVTLTYGLPMQYTHLAREHLWSLVEQEPKREKLRDLV